MTVIVWGNVEFNFVKFLGSKSHSCNNFWGRQNPLNDLANNNKEQALHIHILTWLIYNHCLKIIVLVLVQEYVISNLCDVSGLKILLLHYFEGKEAHLTLQMIIRDNY